MPKTGFFNEMIEDMQSGIWDFTKDGRCSNCGQCCADFLPVSREELQEIKRFIKKHGIKEQKHFVPTANPTIDLTCPFRNNDKHRCEIYEVRPAICRDFQCDKPKKQIWADKEKYHGAYGMVSMRQYFFGRS